MNAQAGQAFILGGRPREVNLGVVLGGQSPQVRFDLERGCGGRKAGARRLFERLVAAGEFANGISTALGAGGVQLCGRW